MKPLVLLATASLTFGSELRQGRFHTPEEARAEMEARWKDYGTREKWEARAADIRRGILEGAGLHPLPENRSTPGTRRHSVREMDGYTVENVALETAPGFFVCGNLYLPFGRSGKRPVVLSSHGHWPGTPLEHGRFQEMTQLRCGALARMGCAVIAWDMVGHGESAIAGWKHNSDPQELRLQLWNSIRILDFMLSLPDSDPAKVAVTGESGGATQAFLLAAVDPRVRASIPCVQVSAWFYGGCACESGLPIHVRPTHTANNAEIAATFAPKPLLVISDGADWTRDNPELEYPHLRKIYGLFEREGAVKNVHLADEGHDYGPSKRQALYEFIASNFGLKLADADESKVTVQPAERLQAFDNDHPRPKSETPPNEAIRLF